MHVVTPHKALSIHIITSLTMLLMEWFSIIHTYTFLLLYLVLIASFLVHSLFPQTRKSFYFEHILGHHLMQKITENRKRPTSAHSKSSISHNWDQFRLQVIEPLTYFNYFKHDFSIKTMSKCPIGAHALSTAKNNTNLLIHWEKYEWLSLNVCWTIVSTHRKLMLVERFQNWKIEVEWQKVIFPK